MPQRGLHLCVPSPGTLVSTLGPSRHLSTYGRTFGTSTRSSSSRRGCPLCSRCTVIATRARWFGDVQESVAKLSLSSYSYQSDEFFVQSTPLEETNLKQCRNATPHLCEHNLDVARHGRCRRDVVTRAPCLHERKEARVCDDAEWSQTLGDPLNYLHPVQ